MVNFYNLNDFEKEKYIENNFWQLSNKEILERFKFENFDDTRVYSRTLYNLLSNFDILTEEKVDKLYNIFGIDFRRIKKHLNQVEIYISDLIDFDYLNDEECYVMKRNNLSKIITSLHNSEDVRLAIQLWQKNKDRIYFQKTKEFINTFDDIKEFKNKETLFYKQAYSKALSLNEKKEILIRKFFNTSLKELKNILRQIKENNYETQIEYYDFLNNIIECNSVLKLDLLFTSLIENNSLIEEIKSDYKALCVRNIVDTINQTQTPINYSLHKNVKIYDMSNKPFNLLIHKTNAVSNNFYIDPIDWNNYENKEGTTTISCSGISELFLGRVEKTDGEPNVYFGFSNLSEDEILDMGPQNINMSGAINDILPSSIFGEKFMNFDKLMERTFDQYNEISLFRRNIITGELVKPSYIVCFDQIDDYSVSVAQKMDLPIYYIDTRIVYKNTRTKLNKILEENTYYESMEKNIELANKILSFAYGAYCSGRLEIDKDCLNQFLIRTQKSSELSENYKKQIVQYCKKINDEIGFGMGDKYTMIR